MAMQAPDCQVPMASSRRQCAQGDASVLAATAPEAATAGTPMPGKVESPQHSSPAGQDCPVNQALVSLQRIECKWTMSRLPSMQQNAAWTFAAGPDWAQAGKGMRIAWGPGPQACLEWEW